MTYFSNNSLGIHKATNGKTSMELVGQKVISIISLRQLILQGSRELLKFTIVSTSKFHLRLNVRIRSLLDRVHNGVGRI